MNRRKSYVGDLLDGFAAGMQLSNQMRDARMGAELRDASATQPVQDGGAVTEGSTEAVQQQLDSGAGVGEARNLTASRAPASYQFMGKTQDTAFTPDQVSAARRQAQVGVMEKYGRFEEANRLRAQDQQIALQGLQAARDSQRFEWEKNDQATKQAQQQREQAYTEGRQKTFEDSIYGQRHAAYAREMDDYVTKKSAYDAETKAGNLTAVPPTRPSRPTLTVGESLLDQAGLLAHDIRYGKADAASLTKFAELQKQVEDEGYTRALRSGQAGAPLAQIIDQFNASGKGKIDPRAIISDAMEDRGGGVKSRVVTYLAPDGSTRKVDTLAELDALDKADKVFARVHQANAESRADQHLGLATQDAARRQQEFNESAPERRAKNVVSDLRLQLADEEDPAKQSRIESKLRAISAGVKGAGGVQADPAHIREAQSLVAAKVAPDMGTALEMVIVKPDKMHQGYVDSFLKQGLSAEKAVAAADRVMEGMSWRRNGSMWTRSGGGGVTPNDAAVQALQQNPDKASDFDAKFGKGAAARILQPGQIGLNAGVGRTVGTAAAAGDPRQIQPGVQAQRDAEAGALMIRNEYGGDAARAQQDLVAMRAEIARAPAGDARAMLQGQASRLAAGIASLSARQETAAPQSAARSLAAGGLGSAATPAPASSASAVAAQVGLQPRAAPAPAAPAAARQQAAEPPEAAAFDKARAAVEAASVTVDTARDKLRSYGSKQRQTDPAGFAEAQKSVDTAEAALRLAKEQRSAAQTAFERVMAGQAPTTTRYASP